MKSEEEKSKRMYIDKDPIDSRIKRPRYNRYTMRLNKPYSSLRCCSFVEVVVGRRPVVVVGSTVEEEVVGSNLGEVVVGSTVVEVVGCCTCLFRSGCCCRCRSSLGFGEEGLEEVGGTWCG